MNKVKAAFDKDGNCYLVDFCYVDGFIVARQVFATWADASRLIETWLTGISGDALRAILDPDPRD